MSNFTMKEIIFMTLIFVSSITLVFVGQRNIGYSGLLLEVIGIGLLLLDLYLYNRKYK